MYTVIHDIYLTKNNNDIHIKKAILIYTSFLKLFIIIILSCNQHGYPWHSLATPPYRSSLLVGPQGCIAYLHRAAVCRFKLVALLLLGHFVFVGFFQLHLEEVFTSARFSLTANVSHRTLDLVLSFVGMHFAAASKCALTKFSYSSFRVRISVFSCSASNLFLNANTYLSQIFLLLRRAQS